MAKRNAALQRFLKTVRSPEYKQQQLLKKKFKDAKRKASTTPHIFEELEIADVQTRTPFLIGQHLLLHKQQLKKTELKELLK